MRTLKAKDIMTRPVISAMMSASARDIALQIVSGIYNGMPVVDGNGEVIGMVTECNLLEQVLSGRDLVKLTAADIMSKNPVTVDRETPLAEVLEIMITHGIMRVPVTERGCLVGMIARRDVLKTCIEPEFVTCS